MSYGAAPSLLSGPLSTEAEYEEIHDPEHLKTTSIPTQENLSYKSTIVTTEKNISYGTGPFVSSGKLSTEVVYEDLNTRSIPTPSYESTIVATEKNISYGTGPFPSSGKLSIEVVYEDLNTSKHTNSRKPVF